MNIRFLFIHLPYRLSWYLGTNDNWIPIGDLWKDWGIY